MQHFSKSLPFAVSLANSLSGYPVGVALRILRDGGPDYSAATHLETMHRSAVHWAAIFEMAAKAPDRSGRQR